MQSRVTHSPTFSVLEFVLDDGETVMAQPNSMLTMTSGIVIKARMGNSSSGSRWFNGLKNLAGGENFFTSIFTAKKPNQELCLAPDSYGEIISIDIDSDHQYYLTRGSFLASVGDCSLSVKYSGFKGWMSKKGLFLLSIAGTGTVFCQTYGAVVSRDLADGERFFVDNRFVVAFSQTIQYQLVKATENVKDTILSGEGLVNRYTGPGRIYYQTRSKPGSGIIMRAIDATF